MEFGNGAAPTFGGTFGSGPGKAKARVNPFAEKVADPLADVEYTGDLAADATAELDAIQAGFRQRKQAEDKRVLDATDSEYWFTLCFKTREDCERFLRAAGLLSLGDKYLDGHRAAELLGIDMTS